MLHGMFLVHTTQSTMTQLAVSLARFCSHMEAGWPHLDRQQSALLVVCVYWVLLLMAKVCLAGL